MDSCVFCFLWVFLVEITCVGTAHICSAPVVPHKHTDKTSAQHGQLHQMCLLLFCSLTSNWRTGAYWGPPQSNHTPSKRQSNTNPECTMILHRMQLTTHCRRLWRSRIVFAAVWRVQPWFGGQRGIWGWRWLCDAHALGPLSLGCQHHLLTLWMAALVRSMGAGRTDALTTCFSQFVWKPAAGQPERENFSTEGRQTNTWCLCVQLRYTVGWVTCLTFF